MPYLNDEEIDNLVSRAVSKALGNRKEERRVANRNAVDDIVSEADGDERLIASGGSGGFSAACAQSHQSLIEKQKLAAQRELRNNPGCIKTPTALHSFRRSYSAVPTNDLDNIIREYSA